MRTEQIAYQQQPDYSETASDDAVASFSASGYSETRTDPTRRGESKSLNSWKSLLELCNLIMLPEMSEYWASVISGQHVPSTSVVETDWSGSKFGLAPSAGWPEVFYGVPLWGAWS